MPKRRASNIWHRFCDWIMEPLFGPLYISRNGHKCRTKEKHGPIYVTKTGAMYRDPADWEPGWIDDFQK